MIRKSHLFLLTGLLMATVVLAAPHESSSTPLPDESRAIVSLKTYSSGAWISGDWALRCLVVSGKGQTRVSLPLDMIGGYRPELGRWQRLRLSNGRQWLIRDTSTLTSERPALFKAIGSAPAKVISSGRPAEGAISLKPLAPESAKTLPAAAASVAPMPPPAEATAFSIWELSADPRTPAHLLSAAERQAPVHERLPLLNWNLFTFDFLSAPVTAYRGVAKVRARWCDIVQLSAPGASAPLALVYLDTEFGAPLEAELYDPQGRLDKTLRAVSLQKVDLPATATSPASSQWILKRWEVLDGASHNKVVVNVAACGLGRAWSDALASPASPLSAFPDLNSLDLQRLD